MTCINGLISPVPRQHLSQKRGSIMFVTENPGEVKDNPLQHSCLGDLMDRGARWATVHGVVRIGYNSVAKPPPPHRTLKKKLQGEDTSLEARRKRPGPSLFY